MSPRQTATAAQPTAASSSSSSYQGSAEFDSSCGGGYCAGGATPKLENSLSGGSNCSYWSPPSLQVPGLHPECLGNGGSSGAGSRASSCSPTSSPRAMSPLHFLKKRRERNRFILNGDGDAENFCPIYIRRTGIKFRRHLPPSWSKQSEPPFRPV
jgi:hypothetical protein